MSATFHALSKISVKDRLVLYGFSACILIAVKYFSVYFANFVQFASPAQIDILLQTTVFVLVAQRAVALFRFFLNQKHYTAAALAQLPLSALIFAPSFGIALSNPMTIAIIFPAMYAYEFFLSRLSDIEDVVVELRRETRRISWPSHQETLKFLGIVSVVVVLSALFWWVIDGLITRSLGLILSFLSSF